eukprot:1041767-Ditylum_brightwellii.AAC.1
MWIMLLQARNFAQGKASVIAEFTAMQTALAAKITHIQHSELPVALLPVTPKQELDTSHTDPLKGKLQKTERAGELAREAEIHPLVKKEFARVHQVAPKATILQMCQLCNVQPSQLLEDKKVCLVNLFGKCNYKNCIRKHSVATVREAKNIVLLLEHTRENPEHLKEQGQ